MVPTWLWPKCAQISLFWASGNAQPTGSELECLFRQASRHRVGAASLKFRLLCCCSLGTQSYRPHCHTDTTMGQGCAVDTNLSERLSKTSFGQNDNIGFSNLGRLKGGGQLQAVPWTGGISCKFFRKNPGKMPTEVLRQGGLCFKLEW